MWIAIADDHAILRELLAESLANFCGQDTRVTEVSCYAELEALALQKLGPDVIILDLAMPDGNGIASAAAVIKLFPNAKVVILTGNIDPQIAQSCLSYGASGFIPKSMRLTSIHSILRIVLNGERFVPSFLFERFRVASPVVGQLQLSPPPFSQQELRVRGLLEQGEVTRSISAKIGISEATVRSHLRNIYRKLGVRSRVQALSTLAYKPPD